MVSILASESSCPGFDSEHYQKIVDVAKVNLRRCFEKSGQWLENVDRTHLVLASGKTVLQKSFVYPIWARGSPANGEAGS